MPDDGRFEQTFDICKVDAPQGLVFGWGSVAVRKSGETIVDHQNDVIEPEVLEKAAYDFVLDFRDTGEMHRGESKGRLIESFVVTPEKLEKMGLPADALPTGWWLGFKLDDKGTIAKVQDGTYRAFSFQGRAQRIPIDKRDFSTTERDKLAEKHEAMPDGSYPIKTTGDLKNAIQSIGRANNREAVMAHIKRRARALGATAMLPEGW